MRFIVKLLKLIVAGVLEIIILALNLAAWLFSKVSGVAVWILGICVFVGIYEQWWRSLAILARIVGVVVVLFFLTAFISGNLIYYRDRLLGGNKCSS